MAHGIKPKKAIEREQRRLSGSPNHKHDNGRRESRNDWKRNYNCFCMPEYQF